MPAISKFTTIFQTFLSVFLKSFQPVTEDKFLESQYKYTYIRIEKNRF